MAVRRVCGGRGRINGHAIWNDVLHSGILGDGASIRSERGSTGDGRK